MNQRNSDGFEIAYKTLTIIKWKVAGHAAMKLGRLGIRQNWCETGLCFAYLPPVKFGAK